MSTTNKPIRRQPLLRIAIPPADKRRLFELAEKRRTTASEIVRAALYRAEPELAA